MNEVITEKTILPASQGELIKAIMNLDSQSLLILGGMFCTTLIACIGFVSLSGSNMNINSAGFSITHK